MKENRQDHKDYDSLTVPILIIDSDTSVLYINNAFEKLSGYTLLEITDIKGLYPWRTEKNVAILKEPYSKPSMLSYSKHQQEYKKKDGTSFWVEETCNPIFQESKLDYCLISWVDISDYRKLCTTLKQEKDWAEKSFDTAEVMLVIVDREDKVTNINTYGCHLLGYKKDEVIGKHWCKYFVPERERQKVKHVVDQLLKGDLKPAEYHENHIVTRSGEERLVAWHNALLADEYGNIIGTLGSGADITEQRRSAELLKHQRDLVQKYFDTAEVMLIILDTKQNIVDVNNKGLKVLQLSKNDVVGKNWCNNFIPKEDRHYVSKVIQNLLKGELKRLEYNENALVNNNGEVRLIAWHNAVLANERGTITGLLCSGEDITERKGAELKLRRSEERYRTLFEQSRDAIYISSRDGYFLDMNQAMLDLFGYTKEEMIGMDCRKVYADPYDRGQFQRDIERYCSVQDYVLQTCKKDGGKMTCLLTAMIRLDENENISGYQGIFRDITHIKSAELNLKKSQEELRNLSRHLVSVREKEREHIAGELHDELGQMLTALKIDIASINNWDMADQKWLAEKVKSSTQFLDLTIQTVKRISTEIRPRLLNDLGLVATMCWQAEEYQKITGIKCKVVYSSEDIVLDHDSTVAIFRIFQEFLTNTFRYAEATRIMVRVMEDKDCLTIEMKDNGTGISREALSSTRSLGLIGMRERAYALGGKIDIKGIIGHGTTITVAVPYKDNDS